jgi:hypothetical protein
MKKIKLAGLIIILSLAVGFARGQSNDCGLMKTTVSSNELSNWIVLGKGKVEKSGSQIAMQESDDSKGIMLLSPDVYDNDVIVRFKAMALTPATVFVAVLAASDEGESEDLTIPDDYDGNFNFWTKERENYVFAFKNGPHNVTPFVKRSPNAKTALGSASENKMIAGVYYDIEVGKYQEKLWLAIDGEKVFEVEDKKPLERGHVALRIRGTAGFRAGCLIKDLVILSN